LQLYRLERLQGTKYTVRDIEQNLFQIDEELSRDKRKLRTEHAMAAAGNRTHTHRGSHGQTQRGRGRGRFQSSHRPSSAATAASAQGTPKLSATNVDSPATYCTALPKLRIASYYSSASGGLLLILLISGVESGVIRTSTKIRSRLPTQNQV
jgi:hypothetical protein